MLFEVELVRIVDHLDLPWNLGSLLSSLHRLELDPCVCWTCGLGLDGVPCK